MAPCSPGPRKVTSPTGSPCVLRVMATPGSSQTDVLVGGHDGHVSPGKVSHERKQHADSLRQGGH